MNGPDALATGASMSVSTVSHPYVMMGFTNVEVDRMGEVEETFRDLVERQVEGGEFDLERMRDIGELKNYKGNCLRFQFFLKKRSVLEVPFAKKDGVWKRSTHNKFRGFLKQKKLDMSNYHSCETQNTNEIF